MKAATLEHVIAPLTADPGRSAILVDVDGTLAPIVVDAEAATVPQPTRDALAAVAARYGLVACVTGRRPAKALEMVGVPQIAYYGNHGSELLLPGHAEAEVGPAAAQWEPHVRQFAIEAWERHRLVDLGVRGEDKGPIKGFHWRDVPDEAAAEAAIAKVAEEAEQSGLAVHWAKKILEVRPPIEFSKGSAVARLLAENDIDAAAFIGDDLTDLHAFEALDAAVAAGTLKAAVKVGVDSEEAPADLHKRSDVMLAGTEEVRELLELLAAA